MILTISPGHDRREVNLGDDGGQVTNLGPSVLYYFASPSKHTISDADGVLAPGASATLYGQQHFLIEDGVEPSDLHVNGDAIGVVRLSNGRRLLVGDVDPGDAAGDGDVWVNTAGTSPTTTSYRTNGRWVSDVGGILTSPNGLVKRRIGIDNNGAFTLLLLDTAPTLVLTSAASGSVVISWDDTTSTESAFVVERADDIDFTSSVVVGTVLTTTFTDISVADAATYYYRVKAIVGTADLTLYSNTVSATVPVSPTYPLPAIQRRNRSMYSKVALFAPMDETAGTSSAGQRNRKRMFSSTGFINRRLREDQAIDSQSSSLISKLASQASTYGVGFNILEWTTPVYEALPSTPRVHVIDMDDGYMDKDYSEFSWGTGANVPWDPAWKANSYEVAIASYRDRHNTIFDPSNDELWDFFYVPQDPATPPHGYPDNVRASHGSHIKPLSSNVGVVPFPYGATATGIPVSAGLIRFEEVQAGLIPHALKFSVQDTNSYRAPATRNDTNNGTYNFPEGGRVRLPYDYDIEAWVTAHNASFVTRLAMYAAREYGMVCIDRSGGLAIYGEDLRTTRPDFTASSLSIRHWLYYQCNETAFKNMTGDAATNTFTCTAHGYVNGDGVGVRSLTGGVGLTEHEGYYVGNATTNTFQLYNDFSRTQPATITTNLTAGQVAKAQGSSGLFVPSKFPWSALQLLPPVAS